MTKTVQAIFSKGVLKPIQPLEGIEENRQVQVTVVMSEPGKPLAGWRGGLSDEDAAEMIRVIGQEFESVDQTEELNRPLR